MDTAWLQRWIQPQHLARLDRYREAFVNHPTHLLVIEDFLVDAVATSLATLLLKEAEFSRFCSVYDPAQTLREVRVTEAEYEATPLERRFVRLGQFNHNQLRLRPDVSASLTPLVYHKFLQAFADMRMRQFFERISSHRLPDSALRFAQSMSVGDVIHPHNDQSNPFELFITLSLTPQWRPEYGGIFTMVSHAGQHFEVQPDYNSLALFELSAHCTHWVEQITESAGPSCRVTLHGGLKAAVG